MPGFDPAEAWRRYASVGAIPEDLLSGPTFRAWVRSHEGGASCNLMKAEHLSDLDTEREIERHAGLLSAARPYMRLLSEAAGAERHAAMISDERAIVLDVMGDEQSVSGPEAVPGPGSLLSEENAGANGIGTPLAEQGYVELESAEHFIAGFHPFTCQGLPVRDPEGRIVASLSTSVRRPLASKRLHEILVAAAHGIEAELLRLRLEEDVQRVLRSDPGDAAALSRLERDVRDAQRRFHLQLRAAALVSAENRLEQTRKLLELARESIRRFEERARLWHDLASPGKAAPRELELDAQLRAIAALLADRAEEEGVELVLGRIEPALVLADPRGLARRIFGELLAAIAAAGRGGAVRCEVRRRRASGDAHLLVSTIPAPGVALSEGVRRDLLLPLARQEPAVH